jgi:hypothetical protein
MLAGRGISKMRILGIRSEAIRRLVAIGLKAKGK